MNELIKVGNQEITAKELKGQRVVTFKDIDIVHERPDGTADRNFRENMDKLIENIDYIKISKSQNNEIRGLEIPNRGITLITEQGYLMLVKSFTDDLAWEVQRQLVNTYFKKSLSAIDIMELQLKAIKEVDSKVEIVNHDLQTFKLDMPLLGLETDKITSAVKTRGVSCLGGKNSNAYQNKSLRGRIYSDIYSQLKREFAVGTYKAIKRSQADLAVNIVENYRLPFVLQQQVKDENTQINMEV